MRTLQLLGQRLELGFGGQRRLGVVGAAHPRGDRRSQVIGQRVGHECCSSAATTAVPSGMRPICPSVSVRLASAEG
jgi:hypothetical protein